MALTTLGMTRMKTARLLIPLVALVFVMVSSCGCAFPSNVLHVYKYGPTEFSAEDFEDTPWALSDIAATLSDARDPVSAFLTPKLDQAARHALSEYVVSIARLKDRFSDQGSKELKRIANATGLESSLADNLNMIIHGPSIYEKARYRKIELRRETIRLLKQNPLGRDLARLNWLLLKDAYPELSGLAIEASGRITGVIRRKEILCSIELFPGNLSEAERHNIWFVLSRTNCIALSDATENRIKAIALESHDNSPLPRTYSVNRYRFEYQGNKLVKLTGYEYDDSSHPVRGTSVNFGSLKSNSSLVLPCSVQDFETVFGKADEITRIVVW